MTQWSPGRPRRLDDAFLSAGSSSFTEFVSAYRPELLPAGRRLPSGASIEAPHGTTIVSLLFDGGVVMAGDRRATMGNVIANRDMEKVFAADDYSVVGIAGTAGIAISSSGSTRSSSSTTRRSRARSCRSRARPTDSPR